MAEVVNEMPQGRKNNRYPYDQWFDGQIWKLVRGVDFQMKCDSMNALIRSAAASRKLVVNVTQRDGCVYLQKTGTLTIERPNTPAPSGKE